MSFRKFPYGYQLEHGKLAVNESEAEWIRWIFQNRADGKSTWQIAKELQKQNIPYFSDVRKASCKVSTILYDARYIGVEGYPPILRKDVFDRVQMLRGKAFSEKPTIRLAGGRKPAENAPLPASTIYIPNKAVFDAEKELKAEMRREDADAEMVRSMIINLASLKYDCII